MTSGFRVVCSDGEIRHDSLFQSRQDALTWMTWHTAHHACSNHSVRREAEWRVSSFRLVAGAEPYAPKHSAALPSTPAPATTPLSVVNAVFGKEPAHA